MAEERADVVVLGSGAAGCATALAARCGGLDVVLLEKAERLGGGTAYSYGGIWVPVNPLEARLGLADSREEASAYLHYLSAGFHDEAHVEVFLDGSVTALEFFAAHGLQLQVVRTLPDHYYPRAPGSKPEGRVLESILFPTATLGPWQAALETSPYVPAGATWSEVITWGGFGNVRSWDRELLDRRAAAGGARGFGMGLAAQLLRACLDAGVRIAASTAATRLLLSEGRVVGVECVRSGAGAPVRLEASRGVVLATGGYEGNPYLARNYEGLPEWASMFPPSVSGDGLIMGAELGAAVYRVPENLRIHMGFFYRDASGAELFREAGIQELCMPHSVVLNRGGERFADEASFQAVINAIRRFDLESHSYRNMPAFLIMDSSFFAKFAFAGRAPGEPPPDWLCRADTVAGLAAALGVDPAGAVRTLEEFNRHAEAGEDPVFHRGAVPFGRYVAGDLTARNPNLGTVSRPPFYGLRLVPTGVSSAGLLTDTAGRVVDVRQRPIPGLYACGNVAANLEWGPGYQAGLSLSRALTYGFRIGSHLAGPATGGPGGGPPERENG